MSSHIEPQNRTSPAHRERDLDIVRVVLSVLLPPLGVFLQERFGKHFWINVLLTILGYIPGIVHAIWVIVRR